MSYDLQRQLDTATAFFLAGERCALELAFGGYPNHSVNAPTVVNYALAVELALKLIHALINDATPSGHDLQTLFKRLPGEVRSNLMHLKDCVADCARYFEHWRYPYEQDFLIGGAEDVRRGFIECYREIRRLKPELKSSYEDAWGRFEPDWILSWPSDQPQWEVIPAGHKLASS